MKKIVVTGSAGFIGFHVSKRFLSEGYNVLGIDGLTNYYDVNLKKKRLELLEKQSNFTFQQVMLEDKNNLEKLFSNFNPSIVIHLAAQAGVRYSIEDPRSYFSANLEGSFNLLETLKSVPCKHLLLASTSSVYGGNQKLPFLEVDASDLPLSFYAATKKSMEILSHSYSHLFSIPTTCFRFFTIFGPWGRPDMALYNFTKRILGGEAIEIFNGGEMERDFTYIDDLTEAIYRLTLSIPKNKSSYNHFDNDTLSNVAPWRVVNIGNSKPVKLLDFINVLEQSLGKEAKKVFLGMQPGDIKKTFADVSLLENLTGFKPKTKLKEGVDEFVAWYKKYNFIDT